MKRYHNRTLSPTSMGRFEIFEDGSWTKSDPLFSCLSKESRCAMHHGKPVFFLLILLLPFGPLPIPPADHVASPILLTNYNLSFNIHYVQNIFYLFSTFRKIWFLNGRFLPRIFYEKEQYNYVDYAKDRNWSWPNDP